jgi:hypothetical protein
MGLALRRNITGVKSAYRFSVHLPPRKDEPMSTTATPDRFTALPDEQTLASTITALVPTLEAAHQRIYTHSLPLEDARAQAAYGQHSQVGKILEIHQELPGRIHIVLVRQVVGF